MQRAQRRFSPVIPRTASILLLLGTICFGGAIAPAPAQETDHAGVVALVNPAAALERERELRPPLVGEDIFRNDRVTTDPDGQVHLMLADKSTFTLGPNSEVTIDEFVYDPATRAGQMALSATRGVMRFVGGDLSKENPVEINTGIGTIGIRGGILLLQFQENGGFIAVFGFGSELSFLSFSGLPAGTVIRTGFMITVGPDGSVTGPEPVEQETIDRILAALEGRSTGIDAGPDDLENASVETLINELPLYGPIERFVRTESGLQAVIGGVLVPIDEVFETFLIEPEPEEEEDPAPPPLLP